MPRHFIALPLPDEARDRLVEIQPPAVPGMRLIGRDEFHLTLHFLGEVASQDIEKVRNALAKAKVDAFTMNISGVGMFPSERHAKVLWAGVEANADLIELHSAVGLVLTNAIGFRPEDRPYSPHITLARLDEPAPPDLIDRYLNENKGFTVPPVLIDRFILYSSEFVDKVPRYREEAVLSLSRASPSTPNEGAIDLLREVAFFRKWAESCQKDSGEWECNYPHWTRLYMAVLEFALGRPIESWSSDEMEAVLYAVARDNEGEYLVSEIRAHRPELLVGLAERAIREGERDAKWQLAAELGELKRDEAEGLLLVLAGDEDEYVRRRALSSLARLGSAAVEELALVAWNRQDANQEYARMAALWSLHRIGSPLLERLLVSADKDERPDLSAYARRIREGTVEP
jgi:2'-5' RNA ligase